MVGAQYIVPLPSRRDALHASQYFPIPSPRVGEGKGEGIPSPDPSHKGRGI